MSLRVAINGAGRVGRTLARVAVQRTGLEVVAINDLASIEQTAHLLNHDSTLGPFPVPVEHDDALWLGDRRVVYSSEADPSQLDWGRSQPDVVVEATGRFTSRQAAARHLQGSVRRVLISANSRDADALVCYGVNHQAIDESAEVISAGSCTTNCAAVSVVPLMELAEVRSVQLMTVHCYNSNQSLVDVAQPDLRRARAAGLNLIPTTTGATWALEYVLPSLAEKVSGYAVRVPAAQVSLLDMIVELESTVDGDDVMAAFNAAASGDLSGILTIAEAPLVSTDYAGDPHSAIVDSEFLKVRDRRVRLLTWYDNEAGYANRLADLLRYFGERDDGG